MLERAIIVLKRIVLHTHVHLENHLQRLFRFGFQREQDHLIW